MEKITEIYRWLDIQYGIWGMALIFVALIAFGIQLWYYLGYYGRLPRFRNKKKPQSSANEGISVVVILHENFHYIENTLPKIMSQQFVQFELVVVNIGGTEDFADELASAQAQWPGLTVTSMKSDPRFPIGPKMAYNVGIKAARYDRIILTTDDTVPTSDRWLECMGKGFAAGDVVLGYCGMEVQRGFNASMLRCSRLMLSVRYLSAAVKGHPYRGTIQNMGFTKEVYFSNRGFNFLNMNTGVDDLFINAVAGKDNTAVVMNPHATVRQKARGGALWWLQERKYRSATYKFYTTKAKTIISGELGSRAVLYVSLMACIFSLPPEIKIAAGSIWLIRALIVNRQMWRIRRRLGEKGIAWSFALYDLAAPLDEAWLAVCRKFKPAPGIYR